MIHIKRKLPSSTDSFHFRLIGDSLKGPLSKFKGNPMWDFKKLASFPNLSPYSYLKLVKFVPSLLRCPLVSVLRRRSRTGWALSRKFQSRRGRGERGFRKRPRGGLQSIESLWVLSRWFRRLREDAEGCTWLDLTSRRARSYEETVLLCGDPSLLSADHGHLVHVPI